MDEAEARAIARSCHRTQRTRHGSPMYAHVERVAAAVERELRCVALLHDVLERSRLTGDELVARGLSHDERAALDLLTRGAGENYTGHVRRIAQADGTPGRLARAVKVADLDDHIAAGDPQPGDPPYGWARRLIDRAQVQHGERAPAQDDHRIVAI
jgi:hypothetical protein